MKKLVLVLLATMMSCTPEEQTQPKTPALDCNCNRVVEVLTINIVAAYPNTGVTKMYRYTTINDCTKLQRDSSWSTQSVSVGECK
jgi:hypothetical protein